MIIDVDPARKDSDKTVYTAKIAGLWIEIPKAVYEMFEEDRRKYLESLSLLPSWTDIFK